MNQHPLMLLLLAVLVSGEDGAALRHATATQRAATDAAAAAARRASELAMELRCNRLADDAVLQRAEGELSALAGGGMAAVLDRLGHGDLGAAAALQKSALTRLETLSAAVRADAGLVDLAGVVAAQRRLRDATLALADQAIGRGPEELTPAEAGAIALLARQQRTLGDDLGTLGLPGGTVGLARTAADALGESRLAAALELQERILTALTAAERSQGRPADPAREDERRTRLLADEARQRDNLDKLSQPSEPDQAKWRAMQEAQRAIAHDLADAGEDAAGKDAQQAEAALGNRNRVTALATMQQALQAMQAARERIEGRIAAGLQQAGGLGPATLTTGARILPGGAAWHLGLDPAQREAVQQAAGEAFPEAYAEALRDYYRALAGGGGR